MALECSPGLQKVEAYALDRVNEIGLMICSYQGNQQGGSKQEDAKKSVRYPRINYATALPSAQEYLQASKSCDRPQCMLLTPYMIDSPMTKTCRLTSPHLTNLGSD